MAGVRHIRGGERFGPLSRPRRHGEPMRGRRHPVLVGTVALLLLSEQLQVADEAADLDLDKTEPPDVLFAVAPAAGAVGYRLGLSPNPRVVEALTTQITADIVSQTRAASPGAHDQEAARIGIDLLNQTIDDHGYRWTSHAHRRAYISWNLATRDEGGYGCSPARVAQWVGHSDIQQITRPAAGGCRS